MEKQLPKVKYPPQHAPFSENTNPSITRTARAFSNRTNIGDNDIEMEK